MRRMLVISSYVAQGTVGLQATLPALPRGAFDVIAVPTVVLSNHPGFKACAGNIIPPEQLTAIIDALDGNGWLAGLDAVFTGYLPSAAHVAWARSVIERVKSLNPNVFYVADPVIGDDPGGLYISRTTASAMRDRLVPLADLATPNRFELSWLTDMEVSDEASAISAARHLGVPKIAATSIPAGADVLTNILVTPSAVYSESVSRLAHAPHGTGDYFAGLLTASLLTGQTDQGALNHATSKTAGAVTASAGLDNLTFD